MAKKLYWDGEYGMGDSYSYTIMGSKDRGYRVMIQGSGDDEGQELAVFASFEEAKAFADADYAKIY